MSSTQSRACAWREGDVMENIVMDLQAVIVYLRTIGAVYPVAPQVPIATLERVIEYIKAREQPTLEVT